jgi:hypothetical protein
LERSQYDCHSFGGNRTCLCGVAQLAKGHSEGGLGLVSGQKLETKAP